MSNFVLTCESTADMPYSRLQQRDIDVLFYSYLVDGVSYDDDMLRDKDALPRFYGFLKDGKFPSTSLINQYDYEDFFEKQLERGDLLHIVFSSGLSGSYSNASRAAEEVQSRHPERKLVVVNSLCGSSGYGILVDYAADMRDNGASIEQTEQWLLDNRKKVQHLFFSTDLMYFHRSGRVSGPTARIGTMLGVCPLMRLNSDGKIIADGKTRGVKNAVRIIAEKAEALADGGANYGGRCYISHSNCPEMAEVLKQAIAERFKNLQCLEVFDIGTIIASHCGPGTVALYFIGAERTE